MQKQPITSMRDQSDRTCNVMRLYLVSYLFPQAPPSARKPKIPIDTLERSHDWARPTIREMKTVSNRRLLLLSRLLLDNANH